MRVIGLVWLLFLASWFNVYGQNYYITVYDGDPGGALSVYVKSIDLVSGTVTDSIELSRQGTILNKNPFSASLRSRQYLVASWQNGCYGKNSAMPLERYVFGYAVLTAGDELSLVAKDSMIGAMAGYLGQFPSENGFRFGLWSDRDDGEVLPEGIYSLNDNLGFVLRERRDGTSRPGIIRDLDGYDFLERFCSSNNRNLYTSYPFSMDVVRLNNGNDRILQTLHLPQGDNQFNLFAYHPITDRIYLFHLNYEIHGKFPQYERNYEDNTVPCHVIIFDTENFQPLDSLEITNYPQDNYPSPESGVAEVVGNFIVYYFFEDDWIGRFNPAILFIFDTRTNEATWLRVGWR